MSDSEKAGKKRRGLIGRVWHFIATPSPRFALGALLAVGVVSGVLFWGGFNWAMEASNTESFCISCHEMEENVYFEYKRTVHYNNRTGVRATCPDCHVPKTWVHKIVRKVQATNEVFHHLMGTIDDREKYEARRLKLASSVWSTMYKTDSRECRNCHNFEYMDFIVQEKRSRSRHETAIADGQTCIECHIGIAHELPAGAFDAAAEVFGH
jgi:cytochrome c-type protein NapC